MNELKVEEACNGLEAVNNIKQKLEKPCKCKNRIHRIIFMDINMPIMDGVEACKKIIALINEDNENDG